MSIVAAGSVTDFFHDVVGDVIKARRVDATDGATTYLVSLLADFARPDPRAEETLERPLAFLLDEALHTPVTAERFERLRVLGDGVLYTCGFFSEHFERRGVDQKYLFGIGATAYGAASSILRVEGAPATRRAGEDERVRPVDIYGELASKFSTFVEVLAEVANATIAKGAAGSKGILKLYERYLKTRSESLANTLSSHGFLPNGGGKGVLQ